VIPIIFDNLYQSHSISRSFEHARTGQVTLPNGFFHVLIQTDSQPQRIYVFGQSNGLHNRIFLHRKEPLKAKKVRQTDAAVPSMHKLQNLPNHIGHHHTSLLPVTEEVYPISHLRFSLLTLPPPSTGTII
jgi:hypothetical protein